MRFSFYTFIIFTFLFTSVNLYAQTQEPATSQRVDDAIDSITYKWDLEADKLATYEGLLKLCNDKEYRVEIFHLLDKIHHYDTVLNTILSKMSKKDYSHHEKKEIKKTLKDISKLEKGYSTKDFVHFMHKECDEATEIEKEYEETINGVAGNSYSSKTYVLETELYKYVTHVTARVDKIREHVHRLSNHYDKEG